MAPILRQPDQWFGMSTHRWRRLLSDFNERQTPLQHVRCRYDGKFGPLPLRYSAYKRTEATAPLPTRFMVAMIEDVVAMLPHLLLLLIMGTTVKVPASTKWAHACRKLGLMFLLVGA
jgi:hypothetical protein